MGPSDDVMEKLKCICHYFRRVCTKGDDIFLVMPASNTGKLSRFYLFQTLKKIAIILATIILFNADVAPALHALLCPWLLNQS